MTSWLDNPRLLIDGGGMVFGQLTGNHISTPSIQDILDAESATFANRRIYITIHQYATIPPATLTTEAAILNNELGHAATPMITILGEMDFTFPDSGWPTGGCADFTNGSMDSVIQAWCDLLNTLPPRPLFCRLWREFNVDLAPWSAFGSAHGGVDETPGSYVAGWRYCADYIHARCPYVRLVWCPNLPSGYVLADLTPWYPGDDVVDWNGADGYANPSTFRSPVTIFQKWRDGFNDRNGSFSRRPTMICETQVHMTDPNRPAHFTRYTTDFSGTKLRDIHACCFWNGGPAATAYRITDSPPSIAGSVAAYQTMAASAPFQGVPHVQHRMHLYNDDDNLRVMS